MSRLSATLRLDVQLQARNKVYWIVGVIALALALVLRAFFSPDQLHFFMPLLALSGIGITALFLVGVLLMLERTEGTLDVVLVSPLRPGEYLASKLLTVMGLALVEAAAITIIAYGLGFTGFWLVLAVLLRASLVAAIGISVAVRYRSITHFLFPLAGLSVLLDLPVVWYLELWPSPLLYLLPTMPSLLLAKAAFLPVGPLHLVYAGVWGSLATALAIGWAMHSLDRFVVQGERR